MGKGMRAGFAAIGAAMVAGGGLALYAGAAARRFERMVPRDGDLIDVEGARLHVVERGQGPALLLIHGLGGQLRNFSRILDPLAERHRVVLVDRPGSGYSTAPGALQPSLADQARSLASLIDRLALDRPVGVGHSLGGALALVLALNHPGSVGGLALLAPFTRPARRTPAAFALLAVRSPLLRALIAWTAVVPLAQMAPERTAALVFAPEPVPRDFPVAGGGALGLRPANFQGTSADLVAANDAATDIAARCHELAVPVEILFGAGDAILDPRRHGAATAAAIHGARLETMEGGHMIPYTQPAAVARWVERAAERCRGETGEAGQVSPAISPATCAAMARSSSSVRSSDTRMSSSSAMRFRTPDSNARFCSRWRGSTA